jgi:nitrous oxidase accessory protein NosD
MKKLLPIVVAALVLIATQAFGATAYRYNDSVTTLRGDAVGGASVTVYLAGTTTKATIYLYGSMAVEKSNPTYTDGYGRYYFYVLPGTYDITIAGSNVITYTVEDVRVFSDAGYTFNVLDYGAVAGDAVDDVVGIRAAMLAASTAGGGTVVFPAGEYKMSSFATLYDNVSLSGDNRRSRITMIAGSDTTMFWGNGIDNVTISGLWLDGNSDNNIADNADPWYLNNCGAIIMRSGSTRIFIKENRIENFEYGVTASGENTQHVEISSNHFDNVTSPIDTYGRGYVISHNVIENCPDGDVLGSSGIQLEVASEYRVFDESAAADTSQTNFIYMSLDNSVHGNTIRNVEGPAIVLHGGNAGVSVVDNHISNAEIGIKLYNTNQKGVVVANNTIRNIHGGTATNPWGTDGYGIGMNTALGVVVTGNNIEYARTGIFTYKGKRALIADNYVAFSATSGICAYADSGSLVTSNFTYNTQWPDSLAYYNSGVLLHSCVGTVVSNNHALEAADGAGRGYAYCGVNLYSGNSSISEFGNTEIGTLKGVMMGSGVSRSEPGIRFGATAPTDTTGMRGQLMWFDPTGGDTLKVYTGTPDWRWKALH